MQEAPEPGGRRRGPRLERVGKGRNHPPMLDGTCAAYRRRERRGRGTPGGQGREPALGKRPTSPLQAGKQGSGQ